MPSIPDVFMTSDVVLAAFVITTLGAVFGAVPIYCLVWASDVLGRLDRRASNDNRTASAPLSPQEPSRAIIENDSVIRFPARRIPS
jgi:hypothetical protein